jgi:hypothetical protein
MHTEEDGSLQLTVKLPNRDALATLANTMSRLLSLEGGA